MVRKRTILGSTGWPESICLAGVRSIIFRGDEAAAKFLYVEDWMMIENEIFEGANIYLPLRIVVQLTGYFKTRGRYISYQGRCDATVSGGYTLSAHCVVWSEHGG